MRPVFQRDFAVGGVFQTAQLLVRIALEVEQVELVHNARTQSHTLDDPSCPVRTHQLQVAEQRQRFLPRLVIAVGRRFADDQRHGAQADAGENDIAAAEDLVDRHVFDQPLGAQFFQYLRRFPTVLNDDLLDLALRHLEIEVDQQLLLDVPAAHRAHRHLQDASDHSHQSDGHLATAALRRFAGCRFDLFFRPRTTGTEVFLKFVAQLVKRRPRNTFLHCIPGQVRFAFWPP